MESRFVSIWFRHLRTDWFSLRQPQLKSIPFVLRTPSRGRMIITATNAEAERNGIQAGMVLADARALFPELHVLDDDPTLSARLLKKIAEWSIRFSPTVSDDSPEGLLLEATGCTHLWGGDQSYIDELWVRLHKRGYDVRIAMADNPAVAWGVARFGQGEMLIPSGKSMEALLPLPPEALRLPTDVCERLHTLGLKTIQQFIDIPGSSLRRRFGEGLIQRLNFATGVEKEIITPVIAPEPYLERLPCMEPILTVTGIEIALKQLLETLCMRLQQEQKGIRKATFKCYRVDGKTEMINIGTHLPSVHVNHLFRLFENKISSIEPALGIELFTLEASHVEDHHPGQQSMWNTSAGLGDLRLSELLDRIACRIGENGIRRYLPTQHYWPERSYRRASSLQEPMETSWRMDTTRPIQLLPSPEKIDVTAPIPDYPPMLFRLKGIVHKIIKADGPERIEQEWWIEQGQHRDYYRVEDEEGKRYWIFRLGHYHDTHYQWFLHGYFP